MIKKIKVKIKNKKEGKIVLAKQSMNVLMKHVKLLKIYREICRAQKEAFGSINIQKILEDFKKEIDGILKKGKLDSETLILLKKVFSADKKDLPEGFHVLSDSYQNKIDEILDVLKNIANSPKERIAKESVRIIKLNLLKNGNLYKYSEDQFCYKIDLGSRRIKVLKMLTHQPMSTKQILSSLGEDNVTNLYRTIYELNEKAVKDLDLVEKIIEFDGSIGYKINPIYDIIKHKK